MERNAAFACACTAHVCTERGVLALLLGSFPFHGFSSQPQLAAVERVDLQSRSAAVDESLASSIVIKLKRQRRTAGRQRVPMTMMEWNAAKEPATTSCDLSNRTEVSGRGDTGKK